jgi:hypothetical protein
MSPRARGATGPREKWPNKDGLEEESEREEADKAKAQEVSRLSRSGRLHTFPPSRLGHFNRPGCRCPCSRDPRVSQLDDSERRGRRWEIETDSSSLVLGCRCPCASDL